MAEETAVQQPVTDEIASVKRDIDLFSGWLTHLPNPDVIFKEQPRRGIRIYRDMLRDGHIRSVVGTRRLALVGKEWSVQPSRPTSRKRPAAPTRPLADQKVCDFVTEALEGIAGFEQARKDLLDAVWTGFAVGEVMWELRNGWWLPVRIHRRGQHRFSFDMDGRLRLLTLTSMLEGELLPERKFLLMQYDADPENPYGVGLGQSCYWPWWFKKFDVKFWVIFMERFGMPFPLGKYPPGTEKSQQDDLLEVLKSFATDSAAKVPNTMEIEFLEAQRSSTVAIYDPFYDKMNAEIGKAVLGQTATTEGTPGKLGAETARADVRQEILEADADMLDEVITNQLVRWIVDVNLGPGVPAPWFVTATEPPEDLTALATRDKTLSEMGMRIPEQYIYETYGIRAPAAGEAVLERIPPPPLTPPPSLSPSPAAGGGMGGFAERDGGQILDQIVAEAERRLRGDADGA